MSIAYTCVRREETEKVFDKTTYGEIKKKAEKASRRILLRVLKTLDWINGKSLLQLAFDNLHKTLLKTKWKSKNCQYLVFSIINKFYTCTDMQTAGGSNKIIT